jgi:hypothetical protein
MFTGNITEFMMKVVKWIIEVDASVGGRALPPSRFITTDDLNTYWKATGSTLPWNKLHYYIRQGA